MAGAGTPGPWVPACREGPTASVRPPFGTATFASDHSAAHPNHPPIVARPGPSANHRLCADREAESPSPSSRFDSRLLASSRVNRPRGSRTRATWEPAHMIVLMCRVAVERRCRNSKGCRCLIDIGREGAAPPPGRPRCVDGGKGNSRAETARWRRNQAESRRDGALTRGMERTGKHDEAVSSRLSALSGARDRDRLHRRRPEAREVDLRFVPNEEHPPAANNQLPLDFHAIRACCQALVASLTAEFGNAKSASARRAVN